MKINILYEDEYILALDKPSGLLVHSDGRSKGETLVDWINENYPALAEVGEPFSIIQGKEQIEIKKPGIVHRLDRETSGVIVVAKTKGTHKFLKEQFQERKVEKIYNAVVWGNFPSTTLGASSIIDKPIGRSRSDFRKWSAEYGAKGEMREAVTEYKVLAQSSKNNPLNPPYIKEETGWFSYLEIKPKTGRTHQIRVHLKSISHPVVCDKLYGPNPPSHKAMADKEKCLGFSRLALHALSIRLQLPNQTFIQIESPLPKEFKEALAKLKKK